jgi:hypothetical protein
MESRPSLEASTPEEALALARAQYGPDTALDVQEVRTGGVMGFFATQRFVATLASKEAGTNASDTDVSTHADTVEREYDADLEAAIAEASQTLGPPMSSPTRPVTSISAGLLHDASADTTGHQFAPTSGEEEFEAPQPTGPVSPFAAALSRVTAEPVVTEAVMSVLDRTDAPAEAAGLTSAADLTSVALYSVPMPTTPTTVAPTTPVPGERTSAGLAAGLAAVAGAFASSTESTPAATTEPTTGVGEPDQSHINYAAALVASRSRNPMFPQAPAPVAPSTEAVVLAAVAEPVAAPTTPPAAAPVAGSVEAPVAVPVAAPVVESAALTSVTTAMAVAIPHASDPTGVLPRLAAAGFPVNRVPDLFLHEVGEKGIHLALTRLIKMRTAPAPALPVAPCTVVLVGPGTEALTAAMNACGALRADASQVAWVGPAHLSSLVPPTRRISTPQGAVEWLAAPKRASVVNVIAIHVPVSENIDPHTRAVIAALDPTMVLAVVDANLKSEAVTRWVEALDCVDAVALENASDSHDPATWLTLPVAPVALVEGRKATASRWASLLCERLTDLADVED